MDLKTEIFATGKWNGMDFTVDDLKSIVAAFDKLKDNLRVPLKMGHNDEQSMTDGQPALGWVDSIILEGGKIFAQMVDLPEIVYNAFQKKLYRNVSIELDIGVEHKGQYYPYVLSGVALLGADLPAVNTLADLQAYMGRSGKTERAQFSSVKNHLVFSAVNGNKTGVLNMTTDVNEEVKTLRAQLVAKDAEIDRLVTKTTKLEQEGIEMRASFRVIEEGDKQRKLNEQRDLLLKKLDDMVKEKKIAPFTRDEYLSDFDLADDKTVIMFAIGKLEKTIRDNPAYFGVEQARKKANQEREEQELDAGSVVVARTHKYMQEHGEKNFSVAKSIVLKADKELASRYTKGEV